MQSLQSGAQFEVIAIWEGEFYSHEAISFEEAVEWFNCYSGNKNCRIRLWQKF